MTDMMEFSFYNQDVRQEVGHRIGDLAVGGGYVISSIQNTPDNTLPMNIVAMLEAALEYGKVSRCADDKKRSTG